MKRPMLVTVSGMVGSGKSTALRQIVDVLQREGVEVTPFRFQRLAWLTLRRKPSARGASQTAPPAVRGEGYQLRRLTARRAAGYLVRIAAFRVFCRFQRGAQWRVADRYFYDSFAHYDLSLGAGRVYAAILSRLVPRPDLSFLLVASRETITARRPQYSTEYISDVGRAYRQVKQLFPGIIEVSSEPDQHGLEVVAARVREKLAR